MISTRSSSGSSIRNLLRHPRFSLVLLLLLLTSLLYISSLHTNFGHSDPFADVHGDDQVTLARAQQFKPSTTRGSGVQKPLSVRLTDAEAIYQKTLRQRRQLIKKHGPTPKGIDAFPPNVPPWPPYTLYDFFPASFNCPWEVERVGVLGDGGKWMCGLSRLVEKKCVVYSFGINRESSFEAELLERAPHCEAWGYDFSVDSWGPEITSDMKHRTHFYAYALSGEDRAPVPGAKPGSVEAAQMYSLMSLMKMNGHEFIDVLKIDVEGWEFATISALLKSWKDTHGPNTPLPFGQLQLEIHAWNQEFPAFLKWWNELEELGLRPFWTEPNLVYANYNRDGAPDLAEYSFINIRGNHELISDTI